jgi:hypothetical protein
MLAGCLDQGYVPRSTGEGFLPKSGYQNTSLLFEGRLEVKLPTIRTDGKVEMGREEESRSEKRKSWKKEDAGAQKVDKARNTVFFQCGPRGSKSRLAKAAVRSHLVK